MRLAKILDLFFPRLCLSCGRAGNYICSNCLKELTLLKSQSCPNCRKRNRAGTFCNAKCAGGFYMDRLIVCMSYSKRSLLKKMVVMFKYKFSEELSEVLGKIMKHQLAYFSHEIGLETALVPVPLHRKRFRYRGFNQAKLLAVYLARNFGHLELKDCLWRKTYTKAQAKLGKSERLINVRNTIGIKKNADLKGKTVILIDDIATTCSTLNECARILKNAGAKSVCGMVLARGWLFC